MWVRDALGPLFTDGDFTSGEFEGMYSSLGQPALSPAFLLAVTILQFRHNLADREAAQAVADRIPWKYALGRGLDYAGFDFSALSEFRSRLAREGRADRLLSLMPERLKEAGLVKAGGRQRTDSTHVIACVRRLNRIESLGEGLRAALEEIARTSPGSQAVRGPGLRHSRYRGLPKVHLQNVLTGMALNLTRLGAYFNASANPTTRPSRVRELCTAHALAAV